MRPLHILALLVGLGLSACQGSPPAIAEHIHGGSWSDVSRAFDARVQSRFQVGSREADMVAELKREKFQTVAHDQSVSRYRFKAFRDLPGLCRRVWRICWNSDAGKIVDIEGGYSEVCL